MDKKSVLFVCVENSCRSQIAEAFGKKYAPEDVDVFSSGSNPSGIVNPKAIESMSKLGYDLTVQESKSLDQVPQIEYEYAITMGCGDECPNVKSKFKEDWDVPDPKAMNPKDFERTRDFIEKKVKSLMEWIDL